MGTSPSQGGENENQKASRGSGRRCPGSREQGRSSLHGTPTRPAQLGVQTGSGVGFSWRSVRLLASPVAPLVPHSLQVRSLVALDSGQS